jgi:gliding motility-associated-like protein
MNKISLLIGLVILTNFCFSQIPTTPFEVTSILVDGCDGGNEGKNEMVGLKIGPNDISVNDIIVTWPNNSFLGFCTTPQASANLQILNDNIVQCGQLLEPIGGVLPAGSNVIIITSTDYTPLPGYFANLTETYYVVFQCSGNTGGHFANFNGTSGIRTLVLNYVPSGYTESVSYQRELLLNPEGDNNGTDGDAVSYDFDNNATYFNNGCQAPFIPTTAAVTGENNITNGPSACLGGNINLVGEILGEYTSFSWSGGTGSFLNPSSLSTEYQLGSGDLGSVTLTLTVIAPCAVLTEQFQFSVDSPFTTPLTVSPNAIINICSGQNATITASGGNGLYEWSTNETTNSITVSNSGTYTVTSENACQSEQVSVQVIVGNSLTLQGEVVPISCQGSCDGQINILAIGGAGTYIYNWDANAGNQTTSLVTGLCAGTYSCEVSDNFNCSNSITINLQNPAPVDFSTTQINASCQNVCDGEITVTSFGGTAPYVVSATHSNGASVALNNLCFGAYQISVTDNLGCESETKFVNISVLNPIDYNNSPDQLLCLNESLTIEVDVETVAATFSWADGNLNSSQTIQPEIDTNYPFEIILADCIIKDTIKISMIQCVFDSTEVLFPNIFTPDGDTKNDFFGPLKLKNVTVESFVILNRWGNVMLDIKDNNISWDGTVDGKEATDGTYFYILNYKDINNSSLQVHGFIQLIRK